MNEEQKPIRVVIYVNGGLVQDVMSDTEGIEAMIVDYDNEKCGEDEATDRAFYEVPVNCEYIDKTIQGVED